MELRPYQFDMKTAILAGWDSGLSNILAVLPCGGGKTVIFSEIIKEHKGASCAIAHRQELVVQMSLALARDGVYHRIIGPKKVVKLAVNTHMRELNRSFYNPDAICAVAGVDTLVRRKVELEDWLKTVTLWVQDEAHHVLRENKWGKAAEMFPNAKGLGVTATPLRADGKGLGIHNDGLFETMVEGPSMRTLIDQEFLTDYRVFAPPSDLDLTQVSVSQATGDYNANKLKEAVAKSHIMGDVVNHYLRIAKGKLGVTFVPGVEIAERTAEKFNLAGVPAAVVSAKTPDAERIDILRRFKNRELLQLVNVDLFGEGFDLPAIEVVSMARPTESYALYVQQFGRALRLLKGKSHAIIIDHVGNVIRHGLPDVPREWSLEARERRGQNNNDDGVPPMTACLDCTAAYEKIYKACPYCGYVNEPTGRSSPEMVDGDLVELDAETLARMRGDVSTMDMSPAEYSDMLAAKHMPNIGIRANVKKHVVNQEMQEALRASITWWAGYQGHKGHTQSEIYKLFYFIFGIDVLSAQALKLKDAESLANRINRNLGAMNHGT